MPAAPRLIEAQEVTAQRLGLDTDDSTKTCPSEGNDCLIVCREAKPAGADGFTGSSQTRSHFHCDLPKWCFRFSELPLSTTPRPTHRLEGNLGRFIGSTAASGAVSRVRRQSRRISRLNYSSTDCEPSSQRHVNERLGALHPASNVCSA